MRHLLPLRYVDVIARSGSIRKAAERLAITSTALNRRILAMEEELGVPLFERLPNGVRLSTAGELFIVHARGQIADLERLRSRIADLSGERRGHVSIVAGQSCMERLLPDMIVAYRREHPAVTFAARVCDRYGAEPVLADYGADVAMVYEGDWGPSLQVLAEWPQPLRLLCHADHPLAGEDVVRLRDCLGFPAALPTRAHGMRILLERAAIRLQRPLPLAIESDDAGFLLRCLVDGQTISFQVPIALPGPEHDGRFVSRPIDARDLTGGSLLVGQLRGRTLPVAAARFVEGVGAALEAIDPDGAPDGGARGAGGSGSGGSGPDRGSRDARLPGRP